MKKNAFLKTILVILTVFSLLVLASCITSSSYMEYAEWTLNEDGEVLKRVGIDGESTKYTLVGMEYNLTLTGELYAYMSYVETPYGEALGCYSPSEDSPIVFVCEYYGMESRGVVYVYAEEGSAEGAAYADFLDGASERYTAYLIGKGKEGVFSPDELAILRRAITDPSLSVSLEVKSLRGKAVSEILAYSADRRLARVEGAIFDVGAEKYYVDYTALDNSYFDADGNFSYQRGTVVAERLTGEKKETVETVMRRTVSVNERISLEEGRYVQQENTATVEDGVLTLVILTVIVGLCIPLLPIGYVVIYAVTEKKRSLALGRSPKKVPAPLWVMLAGGVLWLLSALALLIVFSAV